MRKGGLIVVVARLQAKHQETRNPTLNPLRNTEMKCWCWQHIYRKLVSKWLNMATHQRHAFRLSYIITSRVSHPVSVSDPVDTTWPNMLGYLPLSVSTLGVYLFCIHFGVESQLKFAIGSSSVYRLSILWIYIRHLRPLAPRRPPCALQIRRIYEQSDLWRQPDESRQFYFHKLEWIYLFVSVGDVLFVFVVHVGPGRVN